MTMSAKKGSKKKSPTPTKKRARFPRVEAALRGDTMPGPNTPEAAGPEQAGAEDTAVVPQEAAAVSVVSP
jgi:hypothetical protein